jgi:murein DD-endopeptidase MepM/ murein hydrolase activator NlpD
VKARYTSFYIYLSVFALLLASCAPQVSSISSSAPLVEATATTASDPLEPTPPSGRAVYAPGELVDYVAQTGDTLPLLAVRFNTNIDEIREANPNIPLTATTMPPGMPMKIPIYYLPFWGSAYQILPDSLFVNGPAQVDFDTKKFVSDQPGWLKSVVEYAADENRTAAQVVDLVAQKYSVSPRLLLALLEHQSGALSQTEPSEQAQIYPMGNPSRARKGLYRQLIWAANLLNNGYYGWRTGRLTSVEHEDGRVDNFDPWQNAASASLMNFFNTLLPKEAYLQAISPQGFGSTYALLFGDPWSAAPHIPGSLEQPALRLPFKSGEIWAFTGGPHTAWGIGEPLSALDFAPPSVAGGCLETDLWATAMADGVVARVDTGEIALDLDGDGDERTGWVIYYLHLAELGRAPLGAQVKAGDPVGHPSCEGGSSTGTHVHIARKYNGEWIPADGMLAFNLEGWIAHSSSLPYQGTLTRLSRTVTACVCSNQDSFIESEQR